MQSTSNSGLLVVGGGTMGAGIALTAARAGYAVQLVEIDAAMRGTLPDKIAKYAARTSDALLSSRIAILDAMPAKSDAAVAIEAVPERLDLKRAIFAQLAAAVSPSALLATNTSALSVGEIAAGVPSPERVLGMHFFNPPVVMQLVEIVATEETTDDAIERAFTFVQALGKTPVLAADTPGFIVNRVARPYYLQAMHALENDVASVEELDELARGIGFKMGPFELMDLIGLDVNLATTESVYERTGEKRLAPVAIQREMVATGRLGRKTRKGFYEYDARGERTRANVAAEPEASDVNTDERVAVLGFGAAADELAELIGEHFENVDRIANDDLIDSLSPEVTIVVDAGDGTSDREAILRQLDGSLPSETILMVDAYATDLDASIKRLRHPERLVGFGILGLSARQDVVEIVDTQNVSDDALEVAQEVFTSIGKRVVLVENAPGLFLGRVVGSIVNEAVTAVDSGIASPEDVDTAMRLGTNYPIGPLAWGTEIGGARLSRILRRLAQDEDPCYAPQRALWVLDTPQPEGELESNEPATLSD